MQHPAPIQIAIQQSSAPLTPEQKRFNKLSQQIEQARSKLLNWQENIPLYLQAHGHRIRPMAAHAWSLPPKSRRAILHRIRALPCG